MKYSFLFSYNENIDYTEVYKTFRDRINLDKRDYELVFIVGESQEKQFIDICEDKVVNAVTYVFDDKSSENERIETIVHKLLGENMILTRSSCSTFDFETYREMIRRHSDNYHVVVSCQRNNENFFYKYYNITQKFITKFLFGFENYDGEADIILLDSIALDVVKTSRGRSALLTKFNNWRGLNISYVQIGKQAKQKSPRKPKTRELIGIIISAVIFLGLLTTEITLSVMNLSDVLLNILLISCALGALFFVFYYILKMAFYVKHGYLIGVGSAQIKKEI